MDQLPQGKVGMMLRMVLGGLIGFVLGIGISLLTMGQFWPDLPYETALPILLVAGFAGTGLGVWVAYRRQKKSVA
ncbi:hypothetical protein [Azohydromonas aeria]|uniref:hypothetical protein n=1 Tax=Azohydromonas aeria TaxID=2590212 RepID=UPI0012F744D2|nr:hypothetical protein [Azohydromonas aeria]